MEGPCRGLLWELFYRFSGVADGSHEYHQSIQSMSGRLTAEYAALLSSVLSERYSCSDANVGPQVRAGQSQEI